MAEHLYKRSMLQSIILIQLRKCIAKTIPELASRTDKSQSSVSRSLRILKNQKLAIRDKNGWRLTEIGEIEAIKEEEAIYELKKSLSLCSASTA
jgi:predicted transcriptional regulator